MPMEETKFCCEYFPRMAVSFDWFFWTNPSTEEKTYCMPCINVIDKHGNHQKARVNFCPSCGKPVREVNIPEEQYKKIMSDAENK